MISSLQRFAERAFIYKLKKEKPTISREDIIAALNVWYKDRPGAPNGDAVGTVGDPSRFR